MQKCAWKNGVTGTVVFQITKYGCYQVKSPGNEEDNHCESERAFSILLANVDTWNKDTVKDWKIRVHNGKYGG